MKSKGFANFFAFLFLGVLGAYGAPSRFEKVSEHCYYLRLDGGNVAAIVTEEGVVMVNPPQEPDLPLVIDALKRITSAPVRWLAFTGPHYARTAGARYYAGKGALFLGSTRLRTLSEIPLQSTPPDTVSVSQISDSASSGKAPYSAWLLFDSQIHLYPSGLEVRLISVQHKARTGGDLVLYIPDEKVLLVGNLYESARYPDIDNISEGSALGWLDGVKQVMDSIPLLKSAIPQTKSEIKPKQEKTLEEEVLVISARDVVSNLQNVKDLVDGSQKLRRDISRAVNSGRSCDRFLASPVSYPYRSYGNLTSYAQQLFNALIEQ
jgi:glyoxylase-like metal-dependent hydrolase (beta-lactamase superfamily II)